MKNAKKQLKLKMKYERNIYIETQEPIETNMERNKKQQIN
jgi:hypothetical protein